MMQWNPRLEAQSAGYLTPPMAFHLDSTAAEAGWRRVMPLLGTGDSVRAGWQARGDSLIVVWTGPGQKVDLYLVRDYEGWQGLAWTRNDSTDVAPETPITLRPIPCDSLDTRASF